MKTFHIKAATGESTLLIGETLDHLPVHVPGGTAVILTDAHVEKCCGDRFPPWPVITIGTGESVKTLDTAVDIYRRLLSLEADRSSFIVGIGGGVVCDLAGFVASTYLRGVRFGFVATTLLSQVDASVGGKNGVNLDGYKNIVGIFNQPEFVICDPALLTTLPRKEILSGLGEVVKHALIQDEPLFNYLEARFEAALRLDPTVVERMVHDSIRIKAAIVGRDERESGIRRKLNFGHTFGHAYEKVTGITHGEAVSAGMMTAVALSVKRGLLGKADALRIETLLNHLSLPTALPVDRFRIWEALRKDKKRIGDALHVVLLTGIGRSVIERVSLADLQKETEGLV